MGIYDRETLFVLIPIWIIIRTASFRAKKANGTVKEVIKTTTDTNMHDYMMIRFWVKNIVGNAVLLLPLGVMMPTLWNKYNSMLKITISAFCLSLSIEIIQLASVYIGNFGRAFDIDDILLNTVGASIGFIFYKMFIEKNTSFLLHNKERRRAC